MGFYHFWEVSALTEAWQSRMNKNNRSSFYLLYHLWRHFCKSWSFSLDNRIRPYKHKTKFYICTPPSTPCLIDWVHEIKVSSHKNFNFIFLTVQQFSLMLFTMDKYILGKTTAIWNILTVTSTKATKVTI